MASKSRHAQEALTALEKGSAPFEEQLQEAAKFIGLPNGELGRHIGESLNTQPQVDVLRGREEWLLRWLLKRLQDSKDAVPRSTANSWRLLLHLVKTVYLRTAAKILSERKFMSILRQTLEEAQKTGTEIAVGLAESGASKSSKKRKRDGEVITPPKTAEGLQDLLVAIAAVSNYLINAAKPIVKESEGQGNAEFTAEYMKVALRATAEDSASILGSWLVLSERALPQLQIAEKDLRGWISSFVEIWALRDSGPDDVMQFSLSCSQPLLSLLRAARDADCSLWTLELEQLFAKNVVLSAKADFTRDSKSEVLGSLTRLSIIQDSLNAPVILDVAIRSLQSRGSRRRRPEDDAWLQNALSKLHGSMPPQRAEQNALAMRTMLQSAITYKVSFELPVLRQLTLQYGFSGSDSNWEFLSTIIELDANVFLIPDESDLLNELLNRITAASLDEGLLPGIVPTVVVPLMREFAKARDLSGFIHHWHSQLAKLEQSRSSDSRSFSAWEDGALQAELRKLFEPSLTLQQVSKLLDWLESEVKVGPGPVCVLVEAIAGSITREEFVDHVGLRLYHIMFDDGALESLSERYRWRSWRILSLTLSWAESAELEEIADLWEKKATPFDKFHSVQKLGKKFGKAGLEQLEFLRCGCAASRAALKGSRLEGLAKSAMLEFLQFAAGRVQVLLDDLQSHGEVTDDVFSSSPRKLDPGIAWVVSSLARCIFVEFPGVLRLGSEMSAEVFHGMLQNVFSIASASASRVGEVGSASNAFPSFWIAALQEEPLQNTFLLDSMFGVMLDNQSNTSNPLARLSSVNHFAVHALLQVSGDIYASRDRKGDRERIIKAWLPRGNEATDSPVFDYQTTGLNTDILALKVKVARYPCIYSDSTFREFVSMAGSMSDAEPSLLRKNLGLLRELVSLTFSHITPNLDQPRNSQYVKEALASLQEKLDETTNDSKHGTQWRPALVLVFQILLTSLESKSAVLDHLKIMSKDDVHTLKKAFVSSILKTLRASFKGGINSEAGQDIPILAIVDTLDALNVSQKKLGKFLEEARSFTNTLPESQVKWRLDTFIVSHAQNETGDVSEMSFGDTSTITGRQAIRERAEALTKDTDQAGKLKLIQTLLDKTSKTPDLSTLLAVRHMIVSCDDAQSTDEDVDEDSWDLTSVYAELCGRLWKTDDYRQFCIISETLKMMLRTKGRAISQWNIDSTLGAISIVCSRTGPSLQSTRAGSIYIHLCHLLQAILNSHRLKLQGHFHLVIQALQALLRCLFTPLSHSPSNSAKLLAPPPWLPSTQPLCAPQAAAFTRLLTLICDPSVSSVSRAGHNKLTSATDKAKRIAGQHMQYVLSMYIKLQLEMKMLSEVREKMVPGLYAIFDTTTPELRRAISDGLDASGRAVFGGLYRDYVKFGKWKGA